MNLYKVIVFISVLAIGFTSCADQSKVGITAEEQSKIDEAVNVMLEALTDSMNNVCEAKIDSMVQVAVAASSSGSSSSSSSTSNASAKTSTPTKSKTSTATSNKKDKMSGGSIEATKDDTQKKER